NPASAQIKLNGKSVICEGDLGSFTFIAPTGKTGSTYNWDFGDTYTSTKASPTHLFKKQGKYRIKLKVKYISNQDETFSLDVEVVALPNAAFQWLPSNDTCHYTNNVCFTDRSSPAVSSRPIIKRTLFWGDGRYTISTMPSPGNKVCHSYNVPDSFFVEMEIEDKLGCKATVSRKVKIVESVVAKFWTKVTYPGCGTAVVCYTNMSTSSNGSKAQYNWTVGGSTSKKDHFNGAPLCYTYKSSTSVSATLKASMSSGCSDQYTSSINITLADKDRNIEMTKNSFCYGDKSFVARIDLVAGERVKWSINGQVESVYKIFNYNFVNKKIKPGTYKISCEVSRGSCKKTYHVLIQIKGPIADVKLFNGAQCRTNRKVFFVDRSTYVDSANTISKWEVWDPAGSNCTINRADNLNKYKNCNTTIGWFGKHQFTSLKNNNLLTYTITDTVTGCSDKVVKNINLLACGSGVIGSGLKHFTLCDNEYFLPNSNSGNGNPEQYSLDNGKTWLPFPSKLSNKYSGTYGVGLIYKFKDLEWAEEIGDDSIRVHSSPHVNIDTIFIPNLLTVINTKVDTVAFDFEESCNPSVAQVHLNQGLFNPNDAIYITWGDGTYTYIKYTVSTEQRLFKHEYHSTGGSGTIRVRLYATSRCFTQYEHDYSFGHESNVLTIGKPCLNEQICLNSDVSYLESEVRWNAKNKLGKIRWLLNGQLIDTSYNTCYTFDSIGLYQFDMVSIAGIGCADTVTKYFHVHNLTAGIKDESKGFFCDGQRTFRDSSSIDSVADYGGRIDRYHWDLGTGTFSSYEKNPTVAFDGSKKNVLIRHQVVSNQGCEAETEFVMRVLASKPFFKPVDAIGCAPFTAVLKNQTVGANQFIWELGDTNNMTIEQDSFQDQVYTYHKPGKYYVRLIGIDSFLNTKTGVIETCHTVYPKLGKLGIEITVLPSKHLGIKGPDILCTDEIGSFQSLSFSNFDSEIWRFGDATISEKTTEGELNHTYSKAGKYTISLKPQFANMDVVPRCITPIEKEVTVLPSKHLGIDGPDKLCINQLGTFTSKSFADFDSEVWRMEENTLDTTLTSGEINHAYAFPGNYLITLRPKFGGLDAVPKCISPITKNVEVVDVKAAFSLDPISEPPVYYFINNSAPFDASFLWDFDHPKSGQNQYSDLFEPKHNFGSDSGTYSICLITSIESCADTVCIQIENKIQPALSLSNVFTPGTGDGLNDEFVIDIKGQEFHEFLIYNRWGDIVFESYKNLKRDDSLAWNGKVHNIGNPCPSGTYFYVLKYAFYDNLDDYQVVNGTVTLIRD
ncbi:MAG: gliding motility-associated-like protein, partial [Bacteroidia bacterium]